MQRAAVTSWLVLACGVMPLAAQAGWTARERTETYAVEGTSGAELYQSIGARGPKIDGDRRTIAHTNFELTWTRSYQPRGRSCVLAKAVPKLTIVTTLPRAAGPLPSAVQASWQTFVAGLRRHEAVHGGFITDMVKAIEAQSVGLAVADDPGCKKICVELTGRLAALAKAQRERSREFDRVEMRDGGNIQSLILALVNGP